MLKRKAKRLARQLRAKNPPTPPDDFAAQLQAECEIAQIQALNPKWATGPICLQARPNTKLTRPGSGRAEPVLVKDRQALTAPPAVRSLPKKRANIILPTYTSKAVVPRSDAQKRDAKLGQLENPFGFQCAP